MKVVSSMYNLKRDEAYVNSRMVIKNNQVFTTEVTKILIPSWYEDKSLLQIGDKVITYGIMATVVGDKYAVGVIPTVVSTYPLTVSEVEFDEVKYKELTFAKNTKLLDLNTIKNPYLAYDFFDGFFMQAKIPWFVEYKDLAAIMDNTSIYGGTNLGANEVSNELLISFISRLPQDKTKFYRSKPIGTPSYVDLMDVRYSTLSTVSKIAGNYFNESITSALIQKETKSTQLGEHVRR